MSALSDEHLVKLCKTGNREHSRLLYERYKGYVASLVWRLIGDAEVARDLTQETFLRVFRGLKKFRGESSFKTWISRIAVNLCYDHLRTLERRHEKSHIPLDDPENGGMKEIPAQTPVADPQRQLLQKELKAAVEAAIDKLSTEHKTTILLWQEEFSYAEIAEITETSIETVGSRIYYAKMKLRGPLKPYRKGINP